MTSTFVAKLINVEFIRFECVMTNYNKMIVSKVYGQLNWTKEVQRG